MKTSTEIIGFIENELEKQLQEVLMQFQNVNETKLLQVPQQGAWSIAQCFEHLNTYYNFYIPKIQESIKGNKVEVKEEYLFKQTFLGRYFVNMMDTAKPKKKYKATRLHTPKNQKQAHLIIAEFIDKHEELIKLLRKAEKCNLNKCKVETSLIGFIKINLGDLFLFLVSHNQRHIEQAKACLKIKVN